MKRLVIGLVVLALLSCSEKTPDTNEVPGATKPDPSVSSSEASTSNNGSPSNSTIEQTAGEHILALPEGFEPVEGWVAQPFPDTCDATREQKCNGSCVSEEGEVNGCAFVNSGVIWRGMVSDEQGTYLGKGGASSNSLLYLDPGQHRLVEIGTFPGTQSDSFDLALDAQRVYATAQGTIVAFPRGGGAMEIVAQDFESITSLIVIGDVAYGEVFAEEQLAVIPLSGEPATTIPFEGSDLVAAAPDFFYTQDGSVYRAAGGDVANAALMIEEAPNSLLGVRGEWLYGLVFATTIFELHRWPKAGGAGQRIAPLTLGAVNLSAERVLFSCPTEDAEFACSLALGGDDARVHGYLPAGAPSIGLFLADDQYVYAAKGTLLARFRL